MKTSISLSKERKDFFFFLSFTAVVYVTITKECVARVQEVIHQCAIQEIERQLRKLFKLHRPMERSDFILSYFYSLLFSENSCVKMQGLLSCFLFFIKCFSPVLHNTSLKNSSGFWGSFCSMDSDRAIMVTAFLKPSLCHSCLEGNTLNQWLEREFYHHINQKVTTSLNFH